MTDLTAVIALWRACVDQQSTENSKLEAARAELRALDEELNAAADSWVQGRATTQADISQVTAAIQISRSEVVTLEDETEGLLKRITDRDAKTGDYKGLVDAKRSDLDKRRAAVTAAEEGVRGRISAFRACREEIKGQLEFHIAKLDATVMEERTSAEHKAADLSARLLHVRKTSDAEAHKWAVEVDRRDRETMICDYHAVRAEAAAAERVADRMRSVLRDVAAVQQPLIHTIEEIAGHRARLRMQMVA